jgi:hypothetical protein
MSNSQNNITLLVNQQDSDGVDIIKRVIGALGYAGVAGEFDTRKAPDTSIHTLDLPTTTVLQVVIHNLDTTYVLDIDGTRNGQSTQHVATLSPGGVFVYWATVSGGTGVGFTELKLTAGVTNQAYEMFLGG